MTSPTSIASSNTTNYITEDVKKINSKDSTWNARHVVAIDSVTKPRNFGEEISLFRNSLSTDLRSVVFSYLDPTSEILDLVKKNMEIPDHLKKLAGNVVDLDLGDPTLDYVQVSILLGCFRNIKSLILPKYGKEDFQSPDFQTIRPNFSPDLLFGAQLESSITAIQESIISISTLKNLEELDISSWLFPEIELRFTNIYDLISSSGKLKRLNVSNSSITDEQLSCIVRSSKCLEFLKLNNCLLLRSLSALKNLTSLKSLELEDCKSITDGEMFHLLEISSLEHLNISGLNITSLGIENITQCSNLITLNLARCNITELSFKSVCELINLTSLDISKCLELDDVSIRHIVNCPKLNYLNVSGCSILDDGLSYIKELKELEYLDISETFISKNGLTYLYPLKKLKTLKVKYIEISQEDIKRIKDEIPGISIIESEDELNFRLAPANANIFEIILRRFFG